MAPLRTTPNHLHANRKRSSLSLLSTRRRSFVPKNFTFAPNVTPITYPSDPASPSSNARSSASPNPDGADGDTKESEDLATAFNDAPVGPDLSPSRPRRRGGRKGSVDHIPRPPNAFMLFRQNFVHQRHVPGSIETSHNSLSKIVGNCWKALPNKEKKVWEALAEKKKEEHKIQYPHYRFQPKHDPEKKRKRQAARAAAEQAERERIMCEQGQLAGGSQTIPEETTGDNLQLQQRDREQEKERAMATRREQVRVMHNHLGHRRSSSVPLPSETYPGFPYSNLTYGQAAPVADPFNFANPALAHAPPPSAATSNGIALPMLPSTIGGATNQWYPSNNAGTSDQQDSTSDQANGQVSLNQQLHAPQPRAATLSRAGTPRIPMNAPGVGPVGFGFGEFSGMSSMGMNVMGMGPRASRQWALGQLGRRASSTQPILQHQPASGAFNNYHYGPQSAFPHPGAAPFGQHGMQGFAQAGAAPFDFTGSQSQQQGGFDGFVGAVAEGFTNPFASSAPANASEPVPANANSASAPGSYPAALAPNAMWYEVDSVDPMTPVGSQPPIQYAQAPAPTSGLPPVNTTMLNPSFNFASGNEDAANAPRPAPRVEVPSSPKSVLSSSAPQSSMQAHFGPMSAANAHTSNSAPGTGMRDSFDFSALLSQLPAHGRGQHQEHNQYEVHAQEQQQAYGSVVPNSQLSGTQYPLPQPVPVRKVGLPCVPETQTAPAMYHEQAYPEHGSYQEQYVSEQVHAYSQETTNRHDHAQYLPSTQTSSASSGSSADASPASGYIAMATQPQPQHQSQQYHPQQLHHHQQPEGDLVSGHELLDGPVDVNNLSSAHPSRIQQQASLQSASDSCAAGVNALDFGYEYNGIGAVDTQNMYRMQTSLGEGTNTTGYAGYAYNAQHTHVRDGNMNIVHDVSNAEPGFSFSDFVQESPFMTSTPAAAN